MRVNPISYTQFKGIHQNAAKHHMLTDLRFLNNANNERKIFEDFIKRQSDNQTYHVCVDDNGRYFVARLTKWNEYNINSDTDTVAYKRFVPVDNKDAFITKETKTYQKMNDENGKDQYFDDIYKAGSMCDMYEKTTNCFDKINIGDEFGIDRDEYYRKYFKYCI